MNHLNVGSFLVKDGHDGVVLVVWYRGGDGGVLVWRRGVVSW